MNIKAINLAIGCYFQTKSLLICIMKLSLLLSSLLSLLSLAKSEPILILALPQSDHTEVSASWERGEEILPGALAVIDEAKNNSSNFTAIEVTSGPVTSYGLSYSGNVLEVIANLAWQNRTSDIIGIAGVFHPNILAVLIRFQWPIVSLVHFNKIPLNSIHYTTASVSTLTDSIIAFLKEVHPRKIGIITELKQPYLAVSNEFSNKSNVRLHHEYHGHHMSVSDTIEGIFVSNAHVILLSVSPSAAIPLLCEAYKRELTWPKYAWILHSYRLNDLLRRSSISKFNEGCRVHRILEGIFMFQLTKEPEGGSFDSGATHHKFSGIEHNSYSYLLYESVQALISLVDTRRASHFNEAPSLFRSKSGDSTVYVYHHLNSTTRLIGIYNGMSNTLTSIKFNEIIIFTDYDLPIVNKLAVLFPYLLPLPILSFIFNTILIVLYIIFHNEPSIKSTSVSISMLILTGCYILIGYSILLPVYQLDFCMTLIWLSGIGLSIPLILATILVKMLRVYHIFTAHKILKQSAYLSDIALLVYTILILSPNIILLILWTAIDPEHIVYNFIEHPGYIENVIICHRSNYELTWYALVLVYLLLLSVAVVIIAIKSRNIRLARFKDTKKVNILIFFLYIVGFFMFSYWRILWDSEFGILSLIILYAGHMLMAFLCQIFLFVPKIWPAVQKKIIHRNCKYGGH